MKTVKFRYEEVGENNEIDALENLISNITNDFSIKLQNI